MQLDCKSVQQNIVSVIDFQSTIRNKIQYKLLLEADSELPNNRTSHHPATVQHNLTFLG